MDHEECACEKFVLRTNYATIVQTCIQLKAGYNF